MVYFAKKKKIKCVGYDVDKDKIKKINSGTLPLKDLKSGLDLILRDLLN